MAQILSRTTRDAWYTSISEESMRAWPMWDPGSPTPECQVPEITQVIWVGYLTAANPVTLRGLRDIESTGERNAYKCESARTYCRSFY
jgi:hypothetical protein